ncbi:DUF6318 family protein [Blastococcus sp. SYSU D00695]
MRTERQQRTAVRLAGRAVVALALTVGAVSGCSDEQQASQTLPSASTSPSSSAEALPPLGPPDFPVPDEARERTPEGALEFTRYYISLLEHIGNGDLNPQPLLDLSLDCSYCNQVASSLAEDRAAGYRYGDISVSFHPYGPGLLNGNEAEVGFVYSQSAFTVYDGNGQVIETQSASATGDLQSGALLAWQADLHVWRVTSMTIG